MQLTPLFKLYVFIFFGLLTTFFSIRVNAQSINEKAFQLVHVLEKIHVQPIGINDTLSQRLFSLFIDNVDPMGFYFLEKDIQQFEQHKLDIDDQILNMDNQFFKELSETLALRKSETHKLVKEIFDNGLTFDQSDQVTFSNQVGANYPATADLLKDRWRKYIKWETLKNLYTKEPELSKLSPQKLQLKLDASISKIREELECEFALISNSDDFALDLEEKFLNSITSSYDPHSSYFSKSTKDDFDDQLSIETTQFGIEFSSENNTFKIENLTPGGPAWKTGMLNEGDILVHIKLVGDSYMDLKCLTSNDLNYSLQNESVNEITLKIKKKNGEELSVTLNKEAIINNENVINSFVIKGERNIGYIALPSFYMNFEVPNATGCANDVVKEILKLKRDSIEGLILDLRFNGGGSLSEAIDLAGVFIDVGILSMLQYNQEKPTLMKDFNRGRAYSSPLIVLINGASASASEVLAGSLQSYNRALIVGNTSFGKSTGQIIVPLDTNYWSSRTASQNEIKDYVKVTTSKLYNVNSSSHQSVGITPDIFIPSIWEHFIDSEIDYLYAIKNDSIDKKIKIKPYPKTNISELREKSESRISNDTLFTYVQSYNDSIKLDINHPVFLTVTDFSSYARSLKETYNKTAALIKVKSNPFTIHIPMFYNDIEEIDADFRNRNETIKTRLSQDIEFNETYYIMLDYLNQ